MRVKRNPTHIFARNFPTRLLLIEFICNGVTRQPDNNIALDRPQTAYAGRAGQTRHGPNSLFKWRGGRSSAIVCQLAVIQITLEEHQVALGQMQEQIGCLIRQVPVRETGAPERVLLVHPLASAFVPLPALTEKSEGRHIRFGRAREEVSVHTRVDKP